MENEFYGVIGVGEHDKDYLGASITFPNALKSYNGIQYNQKDVSKVSCTIHGAIGAVTDLTGYEYTLKERKDIWDEALRLGANPNVGWFIRNAVDLVRSKRSDVSTFRVNLLSADFREAIEKGYSVVAGYRGNKDYGRDKSDGILDEVLFPNSTYGHCIRICQIEAGVYDLIVDNYKGNKINTYKIPEENFKKLVVNGVFFQTGYVFVMKNQLDVPDWAIKEWSWGIKEGITNGKRPNDPVTRAEVIVMLHRLNESNKSS